MRNLVSIGSLSTTSYRYHQHIADGVEYPFSDGTILCIPPHLLHEDRSEKGYQNIFFMVESFNFPSSVPIVAHDNSDKDFLHILKQLYKENFCDKPSKTNILNALLNTLHEYLVDLFGARRSKCWLRALSRSKISASCAATKTRIISRASLKK